MNLVQVVRWLPHNCWHISYRSVSHLGERLGWDALTYNYGTIRAFHRAALRDAPAIATAILAAFPETQTIADIGCGTGAHAAEFQRRGLRVVGCEYMPRSRRWAARQDVEAYPLDVSGPQERLPGSPFDLAMSLEVAEHIPEIYADAFVEFVVASGRRVVYTAAHPGQGGQGHVNEQPKSYWIEKFQRLGCPQDEGDAERLIKALKVAQGPSLLCQNMMVFHTPGRRQPSSLPTTAMSRRARIEGASPHRGSATLDGSAWCSTVCKLGVTR